MPKLIIALLLLIPICVVGLWLQNHPGTVTINWLDYRVGLSHMALFVMLTGLICATIILSVLVHGLLRWPREARKARQLSRYRGGIDALTKGLSAYAMGDLAKAQKALMKSARILPNPALPHLLAAQTNMQSDKSKKATPHFKALTQHKDTAYIGYKRLLEEAKTTNNTKEYRKLLQQARNVFPQDKWLAECLIVDYIARKQFDSALSYLRGIYRKHAFTKTERNAYAQAITLTQMLHDAHATAADYTPFLRYEHTRLAAAFAITTYMTEAEASACLKPLWKSYKQSTQQPVRHALVALHPLLQPPQQNWLLKRAKKYAKSNNDAKLLAAQLLKETEHYSDALQYAERAYQQRSENETATVISNCYELLKEGLKAEEWRQLAEQTSDNSAYICSVCGTTHQTWQLICSHCEALNTVHWQTNQQILSGDNAIIVS